MYTSFGKDVIGSPRKCVKFEPIEEGPIRVSGSKGLIFIWNVHNRIMFLQARNERGVGEGCEWSYCNTRCDVKNYRGKLGKKSILYFLHWSK